MSQLFTEIAELRSRHSESVLRFLAQYAQTLNEPPPFVKGLELTAQQLEVAQWVYTEKRRQPEDGREAQDNVARPELEKVVQNLYEIRGEGQEERWAEVIKRNRARLILLGAPGQGKTFSTKAAVCHIVETAFENLNRFQCQLEDAPVAVWVKASALAKARARNLLDALLEAMRAEENQTPITACDALAESWLRRRLSAGQALVIVDSLDEVRQETGLQHSFYAKSQMLESFGGSVIFTCRTMNWPERTSWVYQPREPHRRYHEIELVPFKPQQQQEFARRFFPDADLQRRVSELLKTNLALRYAAKTPLLMTFLCLGFRSGAVNETTTYTGLYGIVLHNLMSSSWKDVRPTWFDDRIKQARYAQSLARISWRLFQNAPETNLFSDDEWREAEYAARYECGWRWTPLPDNFLADLEQLGLLIPAGWNADNTSPCYSFAHRSLLEYLAARGLSEREEWLATLYPHLWFEAGWVEVSKFVVGLVKDATPLLERLATEPDDIFGWKLFLQCRVVGFAKKVDDQWRSQVLAQLNPPLSRGIGKTPDRRPPKMLASLLYPACRELSISTAPAEITQEWRTALAIDADASVRKEAASALGELGEPVVAALCNALATDARNWVREKAAAVLGRLGGASAPVMTALCTALTTDAYVQVRRIAASALGELGAANTSVDALRSALAMDADDAVRGLAASALGELGVASTPVVAALCTALATDADSLVCWRVAAALGRLGGICLTRLRAKKSKCGSQLTEAQENISRIMRDLTQAARRGNDQAREALWQLIWQLAPGMKAEYLLLCRDAH